LRLAAPRGEGIPYGSFLTVKGDCGCSCLAEEVLVPLLAYT